MEKHLDVKNDYFYIKGIEDEKTRFVTFLLEEGSRTFDQIAKIVGTTVDFVRTIQQQLSTK